VLPVGFGEVFERDELGACDAGNSAARDDPGVGPGDVELAEVVHRQLNGRGDLVFLRDVGGDRDGVAALLLDQLQRLLCTFGGRYRRSQPWRLRRRRVGNSAAPGPEPAPVIRTTLSSSFIDILLVGYGVGQQCG